MLNYAAFAHQVGFAMEHKEEYEWPVGPCKTLQRHATQGDVLGGDDSSSLEAHVPQGIQCGSSECGGLIDHDV